MEINKAIETYGNLEGMVIARLTPPLLMFMSHSAQGNLAYYKKTLGIPACFSSLTYVRNEIIYGENGKKEIRSFLEKQSTKKLAEIVQQIENYCLELLSFSRKTGKNFSERNLHKELEEFFSRVKKVACCLGVPHIIDEILSERVMSGLEKEFGKEKALELLQKLAVPSKKSMLEKQNEEIQKLALEFRKTNSVKEESLNELAEEYGFLGQTYWMGKPLSREYFLEKIMNYEAKEKFENPEVKIKNTEVKENISALRALVFIHTFRIESYFASAYYARPFLNMVSENIGVSFEDMLFLLPEEILKSLKGEKLPLRSIIGERRKCYAVCSFEGDISLFSGSECERFVNAKQREISAKEIFGQTACGGEATGEVVIINNKNDFWKAKADMVLVCQMTTVDFVPLLSKATAIVTNEGD